MRIVRRFVRNQRGATSIEYAMIGSLISIGILGALTMISGNISSRFDSVAGAFSGSDAASGSGAPASGAGAPSSGSGAPAGSGGSTPTP